MYEDLNDDKKVSMLSAHEFIRAHAHVICCALDPNQVLEVIYVSSDRSAEQFQGYFGGEKHGDWLAVSFDEASFRDELKRKYGVCAGAEQAAVGVAERKAGIPSFLVINPADGALIKFNAADDVMNFRGGDLPADWAA